MAISRRRFIKTVTVGGTAWLAGCGTGGSVGTVPAAPTRVERIDKVLSSATSFLLSSQLPDGSWHSDVYGPFKDGPSLTPLVLRTLLTLPAHSPALPAAPAAEGKARGDLEAGYRKGAAYLASQVQPDGTIAAGPLGLAYPVYTSAGAVSVLSEPCNARYRKARNAWLTYLRERQLTEDLGWQPGDKPFGGWGYSPRVPRKPEPGEPLPPLTESNLSATVFALEALQAAGAKADDAAFRKALVFIQRCQNYCDDPEQREAAYDDGGFFFIYDDPVRNKAGLAGQDRSGRQRYSSYGSTTADGLRALVLCGRPADDPRVAAARAWLEANFRSDSHPGKYAEDREHNRGAVYYYYCWSVARALLAARLEELQTPRGKVRWAEELADQLVQRQRPDGSWINPLVAQREDDPLVATALAGLALATCRESLTAQRVQAVTEP
jgi:squalene-hopene/tetraprenyl-beta-curcumene cyclase